MVGSSSITQQVETALWRIAPEKVGYPLVVEDETPMVRGQVTTEALKITLHGMTKTLIAANRQLPVVAQYWSSDPRPKLMIYRGHTNSEENDTLLGEFEVLDIPPFENVNISTLCVIAEGGIYLCARDNTRGVSSHSPHAKSGDTLISYGLVLPWRFQHPDHLGVPDWGSDHA